MAEASKAIRKFFAYWSLRFEKDPGRPIVEEAAATYVLRRQEGPWQIVFQLDHQDLTKRLQELELELVS